MEPQAESKTQRRHQDQGRMLSQSSWAQRGIGPGSRIPQQYVNKYWPNTYERPLFYMLWGPGRVYGGWWFRVSGSGWGCGIWISGLLPESRYQGDLGRVGSSTDVDTAEVNICLSGLVLGAIAVGCRTQRQYQFACVDFSLHGFLMMMMMMMIIVVLGIAFIQIAGTPLSSLVLGQRLRRRRRRLPLKGFRWSLGRPRSGLTD